MFIEPKDKNGSQLSRSGMFQHIRHMSLLRSSHGLSVSWFHKHFVPTGLLPVVIAIIICTIGVINSRAHVDATEPQSSQEQMQFPEGLDYSKFQHTSRNHSRLPCLLCHRRSEERRVG